MVPRGLVPFWAGIVLDTLNQRPAPMAAAIHGIFFGRIAPPSRLRQMIEAPALVVGHRRDPIHPWADAQLLAEEMPHARFVEARGILEWRLQPNRLTHEAISFIQECYRTNGPRRARGGLNGVRPT
jgi:pimeloyl-ACP methyl ester carboxylesterase